jgi:preprotein translocase SecF subunit
MNVIFGTKMAIAFKGGTQLRYSYTVQPDVEKVKTAANEILGESASVSLDEVANTQVVSISLPAEISNKQQDDFTTRLEKDFKDSNIKSFSSNTLSASMGLKFFLRCLLAVGLAAALLLVYVWFRFRKIGGWSAGFAALIALVHDLLIVYFTFVIFRIELNENFVAVMLTILGYSLNDTIVIFDRIRTNSRKMNAPLEEVVNLSLNQCLRRTIVTSVTTCVAIGTVAVVALVMHVDSIISFAVPMMFGSISGCYSSVALSAPIWARWLKKDTAK